MNIQAEKSNRKIIVFSTIGILLIIIIFLYLFPIFKDFVKLGLFHKLT